jgi:diaminopimelate decarboxylase
MLPFLEYQENKLYFDGVDLETLAYAYGTPCYIYSASAIQKQIEKIKKAFRLCPQTTICYAVKANSNLHILKQMVVASLG